MVAFLPSGVNGKLPPSGGTLRSEHCRQANRRQLRRRRRAHSPFQPLFRIPFLHGGSSFLGGHPPKPHPIRLMPRGKLLGVKGLNFGKQSARGGKPVEPSVVVRQLVQADSIDGRDPNVPDAGDIASLLGAEAAHLPQPHGLGLRAVAQGVEKLLLEKQHAGQFMGRSAAEQTFAPSPYACRGVCKPPASELCCVPSPP